MLNKRANITAMIVFVFLLFLVLFLGFILVVGSSVMNWVFDIAVPELSNLGTIGDTNMTQASQYTITPLNNIVQSFTWLTGVIYMMVLIGSFGVLFIFRESGSKWLIGFYIALMLVLILGSMFISNMYEEFYTGTDDLAIRMQEHTLLSWMILYSPLVFTIMGFIFGVLLFSGVGQEESFA